MPSHRRNRSTCPLAGVLLALAFTGCGDPSSNAGTQDPPGTNATTVAHRHETPGETCFLCDATKREPGRLWCKEHGRYEDRCWACHPDLREEGRPYCDEHGLYEDECFLCHPEPKARAEEQGSEPDSSADGGSALFCDEHHVPEAECGICQPQRAAELEPGGELKVRLKSTRSASKAGVQTVPARLATAQASVPAFCEVSYDQNALARITPLAAGIVRKVLVDVGQGVEAGDVLVELHSTEVAGAKAALVSAAVDLELKESACQREERLAERSISSEREVQEADAARKTAEIALGMARQSLLNYGFTAEEVASIEQERDTSAIVFVRAPFAGTLVGRSAVVGEAVPPGHSLFLLADLESMWLSLSIPSDRAGSIRNGLDVEAAFQGLDGVATRGEITWVDTSIDEQSRMLRARAVVPNADRGLRAGMFGEARILVGTAQAATEVPKEAIQHFEGKAYVFVKIGDDLYSLRRVTTVEDTAADTIAVIAGLRANEPVVATGGFTMMSEFLKSRLGAGCVDD